MTGISLVLYILSVSMCSPDSGKHILTIESKVKAFFRLYNRNVNVNDNYMCINYFVLGLCK